MERLFNPRSVAVIGASRNPNKIGHKILRNIIDYGFPGNVYPINPKAEEILGLKAYPSVLDVPDTIDLAIISVPASIVPKVMEEIGRKGIPFAAIISSGFKEVGNNELEKRVVEIARKYGTRVLGPNIFGILYAPAHLNATFGPTKVKEGGIALISQSGALGISLMGWTQTRELGLSAVVSVGNKADIEDEDLLEYLGRDPHTNVVVIYIEGIRNGRRFMEAIKRSEKPVIVIKAGKTREGARAASSHTGALAGEYRVFRGALRQAGAVEARNIEEAFDMARAIDYLGAWQGNVLVITNGGGIGVLATDELQRRGVSLYTGELLQRFKEVLPPFGSWKNPIDLTGMAGEAEYRKALEIAKDTCLPVLLLYCETAVLDPELLADVIIDSGVRPVVAMVGGERTQRALKRLNTHKIPAYPTPERAAAAVHALIEARRFSEAHSA